MERRTFIKHSGIASLGWPVLSNLNLKNERVRIGLIGAGLRGRNFIELLLQRDDVDVTSICDIDGQAIDHTLAQFTKYDKSKPKIFTGHDMAWQSLLDDDLDGVIIATPWKWHAQMAVAAMRSGIYAGVEVPAALTVEDCWKLVDTYEETKVPCMIMENVCYRRDVMAVLNMVRQGIFGEMIHLEGGYQHDLRHVKFNNGVQPYGGGVEFGEKGMSEAKWRTQHSVQRNGDLYPTHGFGPIAQYSNINRGNRVLNICSFSTKSTGLHNYIIDNGGPEHSNASVKFKLGDVVTTNMKTANGQTIVLHHDTNLPRPYSLGFRVQGNKGLWMDVNKSLYIDKVSPSHKWEEAQPYLEQYDHPLWKKYENDAVGAGHGGMDFFVTHAFVESIKHQAPTPIDVYDAATWSAISPLSEKSIEMENTTLDFPDFTRGLWGERKPVFALSDKY
jgi:hypothetical protein